MNELNTAPIAEKLIIGGKIVGYLSDKNSKPPFLVTARLYGPQANLWAPYLLPVAPISTETTNDYTDYIYYVAEDQWPVIELSLDDEHVFAELLAWDLASKKKNTKSAAAKGAKPSDQEDTLPIPAKGLKVYERLGLIAICSIVQPIYSEKSSSRDEIAFSLSSFLLARGADRGLIEKSILALIGVTGDPERESRIARFHEAANESWLFDPNWASDSGADLKRVIGEEAMGAILWLIGEYGLVH